MTLRGGASSIDKLPPRPAMDIAATWLVEYTDGTTLQQYDATHPAAVEGEVPLRAIDWSRTARISFSSQWASDTFDFGGIPPDSALRLLMRIRRGLAGSAMCFMLVCTIPDAPPALEPEHVKWVRYWFPDGVLHDCAHYQCDEVALRLLRLLLNEPAPIFLTH